MIPSKFGIGYGLATESMPFVPDRRVCVWGGWGGSIVINDLDHRMTITYVMNRMEGGLVGDERGSSLALDAGAVNERVSGTCWWAFRRRHRCVPATR
jgi:hypothetical protein